MPEIFSNTTLTVNQLIEKIDTGELGLPELQRPFIWKDTKVRDLFDSMMRGYPIGYLMLWECPTLEKKKSIGVDAHSYDSPKEVIIDGQQRLTSLYAVIKGKKVINSKFDEKAILVLDQENRKLGYVPEKDNLVFSRLMDAGKLLTGKVIDIEQLGSFKKIRIGIYLVDY